MRWARAGLLGQAQRTTHWEDAAELQSMIHQRQGGTRGALGDEDNIADFQAGFPRIDMSLHLVSRLGKPVKTPS